MKKLFIFCLFILPDFCYAFDSCTNANDFTIDRRCYVTAEMWQRPPYKYILKMYNKTSDLVFCTANMVSGKIVTAKHCVENMNVTDIDFIAFDGRRISVEYIDHTDENYSVSEDWIVLTPDQKYQQFVNDNSIRNVDYSSSFSLNSYIIAGSGGLKILKDKDISLFKKAYAEYLKNNTIESSSIFNKGGSDLTGILGKKFYQGINPYLSKYGLGDAETIFYDSNNMKVSVCKDNNFDSDLNMSFSHCQVWGGNSGSGFYKVSNIFSTKDITEKNLCNDNSCVFSGVFTLGLGSSISDNPSEHVSRKAGVVPSTVFKSSINQYDLF